MKNLKEAAKEVNEVFGMDPALRTVGVKKEKLEADLIEAAGLYDPDNDELSDETLATLYEIGALEVPEAPEGDEPEEEPEEEPAPKKAPAKAAAKKKPEPDPEPEDEEEEDGELDELDELIEEIQAAEKAKDLKALIKRKDVFLPLRKKAPGMFDADELRDLMMDLLEVDKEPEPAPKAPPKQKQQEKGKAVPKEKGVSQTDFIRNAIKTKKNREKIVALLQEEFDKTEGWANNRMKLYEKAYGEMGKDDESI